MTGTELAAAVRRTHPDTPVILATGYLDLPAEAESLRLPKLNKPFNLDQLRIIVGETVK